jgi:AraC-like DNA-binding protein
MLARTALDLHDAAIAAANAFAAARHGMQHALTFVRFHLELLRRSKMPLGSPTPLHRFPMFHTSDSEELRRLASKLLGSVRLDLTSTDHFRTLVNLIDLEEIGLAFAATSCGLTSHHLEADYIRLHIALKGRSTTSAAGETTDIDERQFGVTPAGVPSQAACKAEHQRLTLRLREEALLQKLSALLGARPKGELRHAPAIAADSPYARGLYRLIGFLAEQLDSDAAAFPAAAYRELEQAIQIAFLSASQHAHSGALEAQPKLPDAAVVARLEGFIEANWREAITLERLVVEAGVSGRSLFRAFERTRGYSPMAFVKAVRLRHARTMLLSGDPNVTVASAASACNFANPGHFARHYREAFGELPSNTLLRGQR